MPNATTICAGEEVNLNSASVGDLNGYTYTWTSTSTNDGLAGQENDPNPIVSPLVETTYTVLLSHPECGDIFQEVTIDVYDAFDSLLALTFSGCQGEQITVSIEDQDFDLGPNGSITWRPEQAGNQVQDELSFNLILSQNITYTIEVKNDCITDPQEIGSAEVIVQQTPPIAITCEPDLDEYAEGTEIELTVSPSEPSITYTWSSENDGNFSMNPSASTVYTATSTGQGLAQDSDDITVIADINGCTNSATKNFTTVLPDVIEMLPNIFTPGQTENSVFKIRANIEGLINVMNLQIYDRWGNKVYDNDNAQQEWDGNIGGKPAASDVYIYTVTYQIPGQDVVTGSSDLTLLR